MYIVNTTFVVENQDQNRWLEIIKDKYIPFLKQNGFDRLVFTRIISIEAVEQFTYSLQVEVGNIDDYKRLTGEIFAEYDSIAISLFAERVVWFTSLMKKIEI